MEELKIIHISPVSATFELVNDFIYKNESEYEISVNGTAVRKDGRNVFSVFDLKPDTDYEVCVKGLSAKFHTLKVNKVINVLDEGVVGEGTTMNTEAIQKILDSCDNDLVVFPEGTYLTSALNFRSNTYVYLKKGAEILGSIERYDYPIVKGIRVEDGVEYVDASWEGEPQDCFMSLISSYDSENIMIVGEGAINGNADKADWWVDCLTKRGAWRGNNIFTNRCKNVDFVGLNVKNSPSWNIHPFYSENVRFIDLLVENDPHSPNTDGIDPESCDVVDIIGVKICVGDDCIAIKSGVYVMSQTHYKPCEHLTIRNCYMGAGHGGVVFGSESSCGIKHVDVKNCIFDETDRGLRIKTRRDRGNKAEIEDINFDNILMNGVKNALTVNMSYYLKRWDPTDIIFSKDYVEVTELTPHIKNFHFKNLECKNIKICAGFFYGLPERKIDEIVLENIHVTYDSSYTKEEGPIMIYQCPQVNNGGFYFYNVENVIVKNVDIDGQKGEAYNLEGVDNFSN